MVRRASSPASPVTITVTDAVASVGSRSAGLTSPIPRYSLSGSQAHQRSPAADADQGILRYTVHIPPTPDRQLSPSAEPARSYISGTIFTGGLNCATRAHVVDCSGERSSPGSPRPGRCRNRGCDGAEFTRNTKPPCDCGYSICQDCYTDRLGSGGVCPGCKEPYRDASDEEEEEDAAPLPMAEMRPKRRLSIMKSTKANNNGDFDHSRWLFETKGTYGYGNAVWPKDGYGGGGDQDPPNFAEMSRRPLTRKVGVSSAILSPYRLLVLIRLVALGFFLAWRVVHPNREAMWLWGMSVTCEFWFAISWLLDQLPKLSPVNRSTDLSVLKDRFESPSARNPKGRSDLPGIDVFVSTADPEKEPPLVTANTILSILAVDYPVEKLACYLSDDGASLLTFEALAETASFAATWVPFCRKHAVEPRNPEAYFALKRRDAIKNKLRLDFVRDRRRVKREYDEFKVRINSLPDAIRRRSDALNACEELRARAQQEAAAPAATWMADGSHWPGAWGGSAAADHTRGDHAGIIQAMLAPPAAEPATDGRSGDVIDASGVDARLPMLVYVSREKRPGYDHNKKAGAMNALVRTSAVMSNGPFILNLDCDHYVHNSHALRDGICFMLDRGGDRVCFVQFPQRFEGIDPNDRYANHNSVFFDVSMRALDGLQGPMYVGTGCIFRRTALYGFPPPRATERSGFLGRRKLKLPHLHLRVLRRLPGLIAKKPQEDPADAVAVEDDDEVESLLLPRTFGSSAMLAASIPVAEYQGRLLGAQEGRRPAGALAGPREPLDAATVAEAVAVISCFYEEKTEWGRRVGWIYGSVTEDVVTGYRMHNRGWRSVYCVTRRDAFRGTAPINLTDRLHQVLRWATGSVEIFFSRNNALFASRRMKLLQRVAYFNVAVYPFTSVFLLVYCFLPALSLLSGQFIVQSLSAAFLAFLLAITATLCLLAVLEVRWSGITLHDWWRNEQFWVIGGTSAHPAAVLQGLLKVVAGVDVSFTLTSKPAAGEGDGEGDSFSELYEVRWSFLMVMPITIMMVNAVAIAVGVARTAYSEFPQWSRLAGGVFFSFWVLCHLYPFAKGLMGRRGKVPTVVFVWSGLLSSIISLLWVYISPPSGRRDYMSFRFP